MSISALGYIGIYSEKNEDWINYATAQLGMQLADSGGNISAFRMDDRKQRLIVEKNEAEGLAFIGWEVTEKKDLQSFAARLEIAGHQVRSGSASQCDQRQVDELIYFGDPEGNRIELFFNAEVTKEEFIPGRRISGFKTGPLGMGHVVLNVVDAEVLMPFYRDILDFKVSDYGRSPVPLYFFHVNGRHHSFAMVGTGKRGFHHFMIEYMKLDDVGQGFDIAQQTPEKIAYTLGRHTNDYMTSFYTHSPSGFFVETGWGGRVIDMDTWTPHETFAGPSFWGHDRLYLPDDAREKFSQMRLEAAKNGLQAPAVIDCPWLYSNIKS